MTEVMTSRDDAAKLQFALKITVKDLVSEGWTKAQIGSAMAGVGLALVQANDGPRIALGIIEAARDALMADVAPKQ